MTTAFQYQLTYAGVPLLLDHCQGMAVSGAGTPPMGVPIEGGLERIERLLPKATTRSLWPPPHKGRNLLAVAQPEGVQEDRPIKIGEWFYPNGAGRYSTFYGLASSSQVKEMIRVANGQAAEFVMHAAPQGAGTTANLYELASDLYLLPPRPLAEHGGKFDGLYLICLVDERYYWQNNPVTFQVYKTTSWEDLIDLASVALGIEVTYTAIEAVYQSPEPDSQLWASCDDASTLLDAVAFNLGRVFVRSLAGGYSLQTSEAARTSALASRDKVKEAGGPFFVSGVGTYKTGDTRQTAKTIVPELMTFSYPKYVYGDDPEPHFLSPRGEGSKWYTESYGADYKLTVSLTSGLSYSGTTGLAMMSGTGLSGLAGTSTAHIRSTAKSIFDTELAAADLSGNLPRNYSGLVSLSLKTAKDYYTKQRFADLDEVFAGTLAWEPDGLYDITWTYSHASMGAHTRVSRPEWTRFVRDLQHATPVLSDTAGNAGAVTVAVKGEPGPPVALTVRDDNSSPVTDSIVLPLAEDDYVMRLGNPGLFPQDSNWKAIIEDEVVLAAPATDIDVPLLWRGIDGTIQKSHPAGAQVLWDRPDTMYGTNLITFRQPLDVRPGVITSGGVREAVVLIPEDSIPPSVTINNYIDESVEFNDTTVNFNNTDVTYNGGDTVNFYGGNTFTFVDNTSITFVDNATFIFNNDVTFIVNNTTINLFSGDTYNFFGGDIVIFVTLVNITIDVDVTVVVQITFNFTTIVIYGDVTYVNFYGIVNFYSNSVINYYGPTLNFFSGSIINFLPGSIVNIYAPWNFYGDINWYFFSGGVTINDADYWIFNSPVKFYDGLWWHYRDIDLTAPQQDNLPLAGTGSDRVVVRLTVDTGNDPCDLTGMIPQPDGGAGQVVLLINTSSPELEEDAIITLKHESTDSDQENRFVLCNGRDLEIGPRCSALCWYDPNIERWYVIGTCCAEDPCPPLFYCYRDVTLGSSTVDNLALSGVDGDRVVVRLDTAAASTLTGMTTLAGPDADAGQVVVLTNVSAFVITLSHEDAGSDAANRFNLCGGVDLDLDIDCSAQCWYDPAEERWKVIGCCSDGGGGVRTEGSFVAAGTNQATATAITDDSCEVTGADGTKGVILPDEAAALIVVRNADILNVLKVYPPVGARFNSLPVNDPDNPGGSQAKLYCRVSSTQWTATVLV